MTGPRSYSVGPFRLDPRMRLLYRHGQPLALSQRAVILLHQLIALRGQVVAKDALIAAAWDGRIVEESNLTVQITSLRRALDAEPGGQRWIETVPRLGYRFVGPEAAPEVPEAESPEPAPLLAAKPSIMVLPFQTLGANPAQAYIGEGFAEDITTALSRMKWLVVVARDMSQPPTGSTDLQQLARGRGVQYLLLGTTRLAGDRLRVTCQVIDVETWQTIVSHKYDRQLGDVFAVQDEITISLVAAVEPSLLGAEELRAARRPVERLDCWGLVVRAVGLIHRFERAPNATARELLRTAIDLDPNYSRAHATLAWAEFWAFHCFWEEPRDACARRAMAHAEIALRLDVQEPWARAVFGFNLSTAGQHDPAVDQLRRVVALQPSFALGRMLLGWALLRRGDNAEAVAETSQALRMSADDRFVSVYQHTYGLALLADRRFDEALPYLRAAAAAYVEYMGHVNALISCCGHLGLIDEARRLIAFRREQLGRDWSLSNARAPLAAFAHCDVFMEGLEKAGIPE